MARSRAGRVPSPDILGMIVTLALIIWNGLVCLTGSESPVVVVLSESMEPAFQRGDILFLRMGKEPVRAGEIVVYNVSVLERQETGEVDLLTKGDNNEDDDISLYLDGELWLQRHHIMGRAGGFLLYAGWITIIMTEKPIFKVSSPGVERVIRIPEEVERFKEKPMYVRYTISEDTSASPQESDGVFKLISYDLELGHCTWGIAVVKINRKQAGKGRPLSKKQREWRLETPFDSLILVAFARLLNELKRTGDLAGCAKGVDVKMLASTSSPF